MKTMNNNKETFDAVLFMRQQRDRLSETLMKKMVSLHFRKNMELYIKNTCMDTEFNLENINLETNLFTIYYLPFLQYPQNPQYPH